MSQAQPRSFHIFSCRTTTRILTLPVFILVAACTQQPEPAPTKLANPASEYCVSVGGTLKIETRSDGQVGYCHLPSGKVIEEWTLFRSQAKKPSE